MADLVKTVKCLVWDLDDTLWEGALLEGGGKSLLPGRGELIETLDKRGILQSIASRNQYDDAMARLQEFGLDEYFLYPQIGFGAKSEAVLAVAGALNIGVDSVAFIDDQPFELEEVRGAVPAVRVYAAHLAQNLAALPEFMPRFVNEDSAMRRALYRTDIVRTKAEETFAGPKESFLESLDMVFSIAPVRGNDLQRAIELTERTNQLNATGMTFDHDELDALRRSPDHLLLVASLTDRFGEYGKIGLALMEKGQKVWTVRLLLMSCRVMNRGVGTVFLNHLVNLGLAAGKTVRADFVETGKNRMMYVAYKFAGFEEIAAHDGKILLEYQREEAPAYPAWLTLNLEA